MFQSVAAIITSILNVGLPIYIAALIGTSLLLFLPDSIANQIGTRELRESYRIFIGCGFIISISLITAHFIYAMLTPISNQLNNRRLARGVLQTLQMLTEEEKQIIRVFMDQGKNTIYRSMHDGILGGLSAKGIVYRSSNFIEHFQAPFNLHPMARKLLSRRPYLLK